MSSHQHERKWLKYVDSKGQFHFTFAESLQFDPPLRSTRTFPLTAELKAEKNKHEWTELPYWDCNTVWSPCDRQSSSNCFTFVSEWSSGMVELCKTASLPGQFIGYGMGSCDHDCISPPVSELLSPWLTWLGKTLTFLSQICLLRRASLFHSSFKATIIQHLITALTVMIELY